MMNFISFLRSLLLGLDSQLEALQDVIQAGFTRMEQRMAELDDRIGKLQSDVSELTDVVESAERTLSGINDLIKDAVAKAQAKGATADQLSALSDLDAKIAAATSGLAQAIVAATPAQDNNAGNGGQQPANPAQPTNPPQPDNGGQPAAPTPENPGGNPDTSSGGSSPSP